MAFTILTVAQAQQALDTLSAWRQAGDEYGPNPVRWTLADAQQYIAQHIVAVYLDSTNTPRAAAALESVDAYWTPIDGIRAPGLRVAEIVLDPTLTVTAATLRTAMNAIATYASNHGFTRMVGEVWADSKVWQAYQAFGGYDVCASADRSKPDGTPGTMLFIERTAL